MIEYQGTTYRIFDAHTHWSQLISRFTAPILINGLAMPEIFYFLTRINTEVKKSTPNRKTRIANFYIKTMEHYGIDRAVNLPIFSPDIQYSNQMEQLYPEKIVGFGLLNPLDPKLDATLEKMRHQQVPFRGIKFHAEFSKFHPKHHATQLQKCFEFMETQKMIALFHTGSHFEIRDLTPLLKPFDSLKVVLGHSGLGSQVEQAFQSAIANQNIYLELSGNPYTYLIPKMIRHPDIGITRILYGSDLPSLHPTVEMMKILALNASESEKQQILAGNLEKILK